MEGIAPKEFELLWLFLEHAGRTLPRAFILDRLWGGKPREVNLETIDKHVQTLRRKLGRHGRRIRTVHGRGYSLSLSDHVRRRSIT